MSESNLSINLRFLLWEREVAQADWIAELAKWSRCDERRATHLLYESSISVEELNAIATATHVDEETLLHGNLLERVDIWQENVVFLLKTLRYGEQEKLKSYLDISSSSTITRWRNRDTVPEKTHKAGIHQFFGVLHSVDLERDPIFLLPSPIDAISQRNWLHQKIDQLNNQTLQALFPALERLLREP